MYSGIRSMLMVLLLTGVAFIFTLNMDCYSSAKELGLNERKAIESFKMEHYPRLKKAIDEAAGFKINLEVKWDTIVARGVADNYAEKWQKVFFDPLIMAIKAVNIDDIALEALKEKIQKIVIHSTTNYPMDVHHPPSYDKGIFSINDRLANISYIKSRVAAIKITLEKIIGVRPILNPRAATYRSINLLTFKNAKRVLIALQSLRKRSLTDNSIKTPGVILHLDSGHSIGGKVLSCDERSNAGGVLLISERDLNLEYVPYKSILALTVKTFGVHNIENSVLTSEIIHVLSLGKIKISPAKMPGRLEVKRQARDLGKELGKKTGTNINIAIKWKDLPSTDEANASISILLDDLHEALTELMADEAGASAIKMKLINIKIMTAGSKDIILKNKTLEILVVPEDKDIDCLGKKEIFKQINQAL